MIKKNMIKNSQGQKYDKGFKKLQNMIKKNMIKKKTYGGGVMREVDGNYVLGIRAE